MIIAKVKNDLYGGLARRGMCAGTLVEIAEIKCPTCEQLFPASDIMRRKVDLTIYERRETPEGKIDIFWTGDMMSRVKPEDLEEFREV